MALTLKRAQQGTHQRPSLRNILLRRAWLPPTPVGLDQQNLQGEYREQPQVNTLLEGYQQAHQKPGSCRRVEKWVLLIIPFCIHYLAWLPALQPRAGFSPASPGFAD